MKINDTHILIGLLIIFFAVVFGIGGVNVVQFLKQEDEFIGRSIHGIILELDDEGKGRFGVTINDAESGDTVCYSLSIGKFLRENQIEPQDSISKRANSESILLFKKKGKGFETPVEYNYYH